MKQLITILITLLFLISCEKEESLNTTSKLIGETLKPDSLDVWILENYTHPYGIEVNYRWDINKAPGPYLYPPKKEKVLPILKMMKALWVDFYNDSKVGGSTFIQRNAPISINLYGGKNIGKQGIEAVSTPKSAITLYLYGIDAFDKKDGEQLLKVLRVLHHNYVKRLVEKKPFDSELFSKLNFIPYNNWEEKFNPSFPTNIYSPFERNAYYQGFYSIPAQKSVEDDFAETVSILLTHSPSQIAKVIEYAKIVYNNADTDEVIRAAKAVKALQEKRDFVVKYFKDHWQLNLPRMQNLSGIKKDLYLKQNKK